MEKTPPSEGFKILKGNLDIFAFFQSVETRDRAVQAIQFFKHNVKIHSSPLKISKRVLNGFYDRDFNREKEVNHFYIHPDAQAQSDFPEINYEYLRLFIGSRIDVVEPISEYIVHITGTVVYALTINPLIRFMNQFKEYVGVLSDNAEFYTPSGSVYPWHRGIYGLRKIEKILLTMLDEKSDFSSVETSLFSLVMTLMDSSRFYKRDQILSKIVKSSLPARMRRKAVEMIHNPKHLIPLYLTLDSAVKKEVRFRLEDEQLEEIEGTPKSDAHPEYPPIDVERVKEKLRVVFSHEHNLEKFIERLALTMYRVRENKYSKRCAAPSNYLAALTYTIPGPRGRITKILPGQHPLEEKIVVTEQQTKELHPLGSLFVVWISKEDIEKRPKFYRSKRKVLFHISIPH